MSVRVDVVKIRPIQGKGNLLAFASIQIAGKLILNDCRLIQQPGQKAWVSPPQNQYTDKEGKTKYTPLAEWPKEWNEAIEAAVSSAYYGEGVR